MQCPVAAAQRVCTVPAIVWCRDQGTEVRRWEGSSPRWTVKFLHTKGHIFNVLPDLAQRMEQLVRETDAKTWRLLERTGQPLPSLGQDAGAVLRLRCCEYHRMMEGGHLGDIHHHDEGSVITLDIMLTPSDSYEGGQLSTLERLELVGSDSRADAAGVGKNRQASEGLLQHQFELGDALLFVSHKYHCVAPVTKGTRQVLVAEYWWGEQRECGHRCDQHWGECKFTPDGEKMDMFFDELVGATEGGIDVMAAAAAAADEDDDSGDDTCNEPGASEPTASHFPDTPTQTRRHSRSRGQSSVFATPGGTEAGFTTPRGTRYTNVD